ncbi:MAG: PorP/SprF family type IX secretion system membrane protein [Fulvivirga sp.]
MRIVILTSLLMATATISYGQYFQFSQYNFAQARVNPTNGATSDYAKASLLYRNQKVADNFNIQSTFLSAHYPIRWKTGPRLAAGVYLLDDRTGTAGIFRTTQLGINFAAAVALSNNQLISLGVKTDWNNRKVSFDNLNTGSQFIPDRGFTGGGSGELLDQVSQNYFSWNAGLRWVQKDDDDYELASFGVAIYDINRPDEALLDQPAKLDPTWVMDMKYTVYDGMTFRITPDVLVTNSASNANIMLGGLTSYKIDPSNKLNGMLSLITRVNLSGYFVAGLQFENNKTAFGLSYDIPWGSQVGNLGALELGATLKKYIEPLSNKNKVRKSKYARRRAKFKKQQAKRKEKALARLKKNDKTEPKDKQVEKRDDLNVQPDLDSVQSVAEVNTETDDLNENENAEGNAQAGELSRFPFEEPIFFDFKFGFNAVSLAKSDKEILNDLVLLLIQNEAFTVEIIGHTDDKGSAEYNQQLSENRAAAVSQYLMKSGIEEDRITYLGKGEEDPTVANDSEENRATNRRVEFVIHKIKTPTNDH